MSHSITNPLVCDTFTAVNDLLKDQLVKIVSDNSVDVATLSTDLLLGFVKCDTPAGCQVGVQVAGVTCVKTGAAVSAGIQLTVNSSGFIVPAAPGDCVIGISKEAGVTGQFISILIRPAKI